MNRNKGAGRRGGAAGANVVPTHLHISVKRKRNGLINSPLLPQIYVGL